MLPALTRKRGANPATEAATAHEAAPDHRFARGTSNAGLGAREARLHRRRVRLAVREVGWLIVVSGAVLWLVVATVGLLFARTG